MKKIFSMMVVMLLGATSLMAQNPDEGLSYAVETGIGTEWELGGRAQYNFNKYIAIEGVAKYAFDYNEKIWGMKNNWNEFSLQVGARGFSPTYYKDMKAFAALDMGWGIAWKNGNSSHFALDFTVGSYVWKGLYVGYGLGAMCGNGNHTDHLLRVGYNFEF